MPAPLILQDAVQQLLRKLPPSKAATVTEEDTRRVRDALRVLDIKVRVRSLGKYDRVENRAAVLLALVLQNRPVAGGGHNAVSIAELAKAASLKEDSFRQLYTNIGHYYPDLFPKKKTTANLSSSSTRPTSRGTPKRTATEAAPARRSNRRTRTLQSLDDDEDDPTSRLLPSLAIRLASHLTDPHGVANRAKILWHQVFAHALKIQVTADGRRGQEHDLKRYAAAYQAAVLYVVATRRDMQQRSSAARDDEAAVRPLQLQDVVQACRPACTYGELRDKLPCVERWVKDMREKEYPTAKVASRPSTAASSRSKAAGQSGGKAKTAAAAEPEQEETNFADWKAAILARVLERTQAQLSASEGADKAPWSRSELLAHASVSILQKHGLSNVVDGPCLE
jgi:hypothetical protein